MSRRTIVMSTTRRYGRDRSCAPTQSARRFARFSQQGSSTASDCSIRRPRRSAGGTIASSRFRRIAACASTTSCFQRRSSTVACRAASTATRARDKSPPTTHRYWSNYATTDPRQHGLRVAAVSFPVSLPVTLAAYFVVPRAWRNGVLLAASVVFYAWGEAKYLALVLGSVAFNWWMGLHIARANNPATRKRRLALAFTGNLGALAIFKYANFTVANVNTIAPIFALGPVALDAILLPLGVSFFTFHAISYVVDDYKRNAAAQPS